MSWMLFLLFACGDATTEQPSHDKDEAAHADHNDAKAKKKGKKKGAKKKGAKKSADGTMTEVPKGAKVFFTEPKDGATVTSPVKIKFGVTGLTVEAAGEVVEGHGHHHLIIGKTGVEKGKAVPKDETHIHYGKGQTEAEIELEKGTHTLTMQFADGHHMSFGDVLATTITVTVE